MSNLSVRYMKVYKKYVFVYSAAEKREKGRPRGHRSGGSSPMYKYFLAIVCETEITLTIFSIFFYFLLFA